jgi:small subunit ribosomal protein S30e
LDSILISIALITAVRHTGKVHGSLARAGKVKGQTPKVEKTEKKKQARGRAHKKVLYNRRFVNVVVGAGKKVGYNSLAAQNMAKGLPAPTS